MVFVDSVDVTIDIFNKMSVPILTCGCEVWGFTNADIVNRLQLNFFENCVKIKKINPIPY